MPVERQTELRRWMSMRVTVTDSSVHAASVETSELIESGYVVGRNPLREFLSGGLAAAWRSLMARRAPARIAIVGTSLIDDRSAVVCGTLNGEMPDRAAWDEWTATLHPAD